MSPILRQILTLTLLAFLISDLHALEVISDPYRGLKEGNLDSYEIRPDAPLQIECTGYCRPESENDMITAEELAEAQDYIEEDEYYEDEDREEPEDTAYARAVEAKKTNFVLDSSIYLNRQRLREYDNQILREMLYRRTNDPLIRLFLRTTPNL